MSVRDVFLLCCCTFSGPGRTAATGGNSAGAGFILYRPAGFHEEWWRWDVRERGARDLGLRSPTMFYEDRKGCTGCEFKSHRDIQVQIENPVIWLKEGKL